MFLFFLLLLPVTALFSSIIQVSHIDPIKAALEEANENDLIVFDVDETLIIPDDKVLRSCGDAFFMKQFDLFSETFSEERMKFLGSIMLLNRSISLVDPEIANYIRSLQERSLKVMALTALFTGRFGAIASIEDWRVAELAKMDIDFSGAFPRYNHIVFGDIMKENSLPIFKDGILFSARHTKGEVLQAFLRRVKFTPKRVFFIDDRRDYIDSVHHSMENDQIECICFHYIANSTFGDQLDEEIAKQQFAHLQAFDKWLSDTEAKAFLSAVP